MQRRELEELFARLGAPHPEAWAGSQIREGIPQLARFVFLRQAWKQILAEGDLDWIEEQLQTPQGSPGEEISVALSRALGDGVSHQDITTIVRVMQWRLLFSFCYLLDDPGLLEEEISQLGWGLFQIDSQGRPIKAVAGLHESVLETDPTGHEMRRSNT